MRISELAETTGASIPTLKFYLRERLLHPGVATAATRAEYDSTHVERVRLIRALIDGARLTVADVRRVVEALEDPNPPESVHALLGTAHAALPAPGRDHPVSSEVRDLVAGLGWDIGRDAPALHTLSAAVDNARAAGLRLPPERLAAYAQATLPIAKVDVDRVGRADDLGDALAVVAVGTVMLDPLLAALRRLAQEHLSAQVLAGRPRQDRSTVPPGGRHAPGRTDLTE